MTQPEHHMGARRFATTVAAFGLATSCVVGAGSNAAAATLPPSERNG